MIRNDDNNNSLNNRNHPFKVVCPQHQTIQSVNCAPARRLKDMN